MSLEVKFKWVSGSPPDESEGDLRLLLTKESEFPEIGEFRQGRWRIGGEEVGDSIIAHSPFIVPHMRYMQFKVPS